MKTFFHFLIGLGILAITCIIGNFIFGPVFAPSFIACFCAVSYIESNK